MNTKKLILRILEEEHRQRTGHKLVETRMCHVCRLIRELRTKLIKNKSDHKLQEYYDALEGFDEN